MAGLPAFKVPDVEVADENYVEVGDISEPQQFLTSAGDRISLSPQVENCSWKAEI